MVAFWKPRKGGWKSCVTDHLLPILLSLGASGVLAVLCTLCVAKPDEIADYARRRYLRSSKLIQKWPFSNIVMKPWYPAYLRIIGLSGWAVVFIWFYAIVNRLSK